MKTYGDLKKAIKTIQGRTVTEIKENMKQQQLRQIIREHISSIINEEEEKDEAA